MKKLNRHSIRLKGYDYCSDGLYFITICTQGRVHLFGDIYDVPPVGAGFARPNYPIPCHPQMILNNSGKIIEQCYLQLEQKYPCVQCGDYVIMPNHFHAIIMINGGWTGESFDGLGGGPSDGLGGGPFDGLGGGPSDGWAGGPRPYVSLGQIVGYFKYQTTKLVNLKNQKLWQRNYYEHIIRNQRAYENIIEYIRNNPERWGKDCFNVES